MVLLREFSSFCAFVGASMASRFFAEGEFLILVPYAGDFCCFDLLLVDFAFAGARRCFAFLI